MKNHPEDNSKLDSNSAAELQLEAIFRALPDLLLCLDSNGHILSYKAGKPSSSLSPEKFLGQPMQAILPPEVGKEFLQAIQDTLKTGNIVCVDFHMQTLEGKRWFEARLVPSSESRAIAFVRDVTERVTAVEEAQQHLLRLSALHSIDAAITSSFDLNVILSVILRQITGQLGVDAADILLLNKLTHMLEFATGLGFMTPVIQPTTLMVGHGFAGMAALQRRTVSVPILDDSQSGDLVSPALEWEKFASYYAVPLIAKGDLKGVLEIYHRSPLKRGDDWFEFLATLAGQTALAIDSASLFHELQLSNMELSIAYDATIESWSRMLELSGRESKEHAQRVVDWTAQLAHAMRVEERDLNDLRRGALLHDIGKMAIPEKILNKPGSFTEEEWEVVKRHPRQAFELLSPIKHLASALEIPRYHHERWNGSGYPDGLRGSQIPLSARIFAVVDVYDALINERPCRPAWSKQAARAYLQEQAGILFDPDVVKAFLQTIGLEK